MTKSAEDYPMDEKINQAEEKMQKSVELFTQELAGIRTGRANPNMLDHIKVNVYGQDMPINNVASVNVQDAKTLHISVWDQNNIKLVDKAIQTSDLGLNPRVNGNDLFISMPDLTEERRKDYVKIIKQKSEDAKIKIRNIRRDINDDLKKMEKNKELTEDDLKNLLDQTQETTDNYIKKVDDLSENKQKNIMEI